MENMLTYVDYWLLNAYVYEGFEVGLCMGIDFRFTGSGWQIFSNHKPTTKVS